MRALTALLTAGTLAISSAPADPPSVEMVFLDVGQGDAIVVRSPEGKVALIDAGRAWILGQLRVHGIDSIDLAIATHPHADHIGGMAEVLRELPVRYYMDNGTPHSTATYSNLMQVVEQSGVTYLQATARTITLGSVSLRILPPAPDAEGHNRSIGVLIEYGEFSAILTGDSEIEELNHFLDSGIDEVTVLKAAHHGARNGVSPAWLAATRPRVVVISVGMGNGYGHPDPMAIRYYKAVSREIYRTDLHGEVTIHGRRDGTYQVRTIRGERLAHELDAAESPDALDVGIAKSETSGGISVWVYPDAGGYDQFNLNGEYAVVKNTSADTVDIAGWHLCNFERHCYTFPGTAVIAPQDSVLVFTGVGHTHGREFYQGFWKAVWDNESDVAILRDPDGKVIARYVYRTRLRGRPSR